MVCSKFHPAQVFERILSIYSLSRSKVCVQKLVLGEIYCKPWPSGVSLESPELKNIPQDSGKRDDVDQNHDGRNAGSATVSVLKTSRDRLTRIVILGDFGSIFWNFSDIFKSGGLQYISQVPENREDVGQNHDARTPVSATL